MSQFIDLDNGLYWQYVMPNWHQTITDLTNASLLTHMNKFQWYLNQLDIIFTDENVLESVVCELCAIL